MKNPKTTLLGILTIIAALSAAGIDYLQHGNLPNMGVLLPMLMSGFAAIHAKDDDAPNPPYPQATRRMIPVIAALLLPALLLTSCSTTPTGNPTIDRRNRVANALLTAAAKTIGKFAASTLQNVVQSEMNGSKIDYASAAAAGAWASASTVVNSSDVESIINAWGGDKIPATASAAQRQYDLAIESGVSPDLALTAIAGIIGGTSQAAK